MTLPGIVDPGLIAGACGTLGALICLLALRKHRLASRQTHAVLESELRTILAEHKLECFAQIERATANSSGGAIGRREMALIAGIARMLSAS